MTESASREAGRQVAEVGFVIRAASGNTCWFHCL